MKFSKRTWFIGGTVLAATLAWWSFRPSDADHYLDRIVRLIDERRWAELAHEVLPKEAHENEWTPEKFECLLSKLQPASDSSVSRQSTRVMAPGIYSARLAVGSKAPFWTLVVHHTGERFYSSLATVPLFVNKWDLSTDDKRLARLADSLEGCGLRAVRTEKGSELTIDALRLMVGTGLKTGKAWKPHGE